MLAIGQYDDDEPGPLVSAWCCIANPHLELGVQSSREDTHITGPCLFPPSADCGRQTWLGNPDPGLALSAAGIRKRADKRSLSDGLFLHLSNKLIKLNTKI